MALTTTTPPPDLVAEISGVDPRGAGARDRRRTDGDLVMWNSRRTMRRAREHDETPVRDMRGTSVSDGVPTPPQRAAA
jgi:hypothetical protein